MKIGLFGCGNMGGALLSGILGRKVAQPSDVMVYDIDAAKASSYAQSQGVKAASSMAELAAFAGIVIVAVKPGDVENLLETVKGELNDSGKVVVSIAAGVKTNLMKKVLPQAQVVRVMPNTPALVGEGASALYFCPGISEVSQKEVLSIFQSCGIAEVVSKEELLDAVTGLSGSGPAYVYAFINSLSDAGVLEGLTRPAARRLAAQTVLGSARMVLQALEKGIHMEELKDQVTSPGGTTAAGLYELEKGCFRGTIISGVSAAAKKSRELGAKL